MKVKRLIPAVAMLLVSAMLLGTSTFAWFSMSRDVTATDMEITAKSDAIFLMIQGSEDATMGQTGHYTGVAKQVYPVHHEAWSALADIEDFDKKKTVINHFPIDWFYGTDADKSDWQKTNQEVHMVFNPVPEDAFTTE